MASRLNYQVNVSLPQGYFTVTIRANRNSFDPQIHYREACREAFKYFSTPVFMGGGYTDNDPGVIFLGIAMPKDT